MLASSRMAFHTILEIGDAFLQMLRADIRFVVFVATVASVGGECAGVTGDARRHPVLAVIQREGMRLVILRGSPGLGGMAGGTVHAEQSQMENRIGMATDALRGRPCKLSADVTLLTLHALVRACQRKGAARVIKVRIIPIICIVTGRAVCAKLAVMLVVARVAGIAIVAEQGMIHAGIFPIGGSMTSRAVRPEAAIMFIVLPVAGIAVGGRPRKDIVLVAVFATRFGVFALQLERG